MSEQPQREPGEDSATAGRMVTWLVVQFVLSELAPQFDIVLREAIKQAGVAQIKQELKSAGISDEQLAQVFARIGH